MLNKIVLTTIHTSSQACEAMRSDAFEDPNSYSGWFYPLRYLLSLRYLKIKQDVLTQFRQEKIYPISNENFTVAVIQQLQGNQAHSASFPMNNAKDNSHTTPFYSRLFKSTFIYPVLLLALGIGVYQTHNLYQNKRIENVLANYLPYYSDLLHRKLLLTHNQGSKKNIAVIDASIEKTQHKILSSLPEKQGIRQSMKAQLLKLKDPALDSEQIMLGFKSLNTLFDQHHQPYYLTPKSFSMPCSSLIDAPIEQMMILKKLESLMSNNKPERCRTTMMTTYKVGDRRQLFLLPDNKNTTKDRPKNEELPLFHVQRIDKVPAVDGALGLTFKDRGIGSIILTDRVKNFAQESVLPALSFQGRNYIIPYWMQGHYEIEEVVTKAYKKDIAQIYPDQTEQRKVKALIKRLINDKARMQNSKIRQTMQRTNSNNDQSLFGNGLDAISVLLGNSNKKSTQRNKVKSLPFTQEDNALLDKLEAALYPSIEYHEAYHQINKKHWSEPSWLKATFGDNLNENATEHTLEELGAYLFQLANTQEAQNVWLSKLLIFSLNPMTKGQAEYYASSIIFNAFDALDTSATIRADYVATADDKTRIFTKLLTLEPNEINLLSRYIFENLFERKIPEFSNKQ